MRRKDKEITEAAQIRGILERGKVCRIAFFDDEFPYMVPVCFGFDGDPSFSTASTAAKRWNASGKTPGSASRSKRTSR